MRVRDDDLAPVEVQFRAPTLERVFDRICDGRERPSTPDKGLWKQGIVMGQVSDESGRPVDGAQVLVLARAETSDDEEPWEWVSFAAETESSFYRVCWVPVGVPLSVVVLQEDEEVDAGDLSGEITPADLFPDRIRNITIASEQPYRTVHLAGGHRLAR